MALSDRSMGYELSNVEKEIACNPKYRDVGYVRYHKQDGYFFLDYSKYKKNEKNEIYYTGGIRPPEGRYVDVRVEDEKQIFSDKSGKDGIKILEISHWKEFDVTHLAMQRKILDYREVIEYFSYPYRGEPDRVLSIAFCSSLFAFSSPPIRKDTGGIGSAVFGLKYQWEAFTKPLEIIPPEFRKIDSDVYYHISQKEKMVNKISGEINQAIRLPEKMIYDIPIVVDEVSPKNFLKDYQESLSDAAKIIQAQLLDSYIIHPENLNRIEKEIVDVTYEMREKYLSGKKRNYRQNIGDAIPKLASSYARLQCSPEISREDISMVMDLWSYMYDEVSGRYSSPMGIIKPFRLVGDSRNIYYKLCDIYPTESFFPIREAITVTGADPLEFQIALDSMVQEGYARRKGNSMMLLDP